MNARLVFIRAACLLVALTCITFSSATCACAQWTSSYGNNPLTQGPQQGYTVGTGDTQNLPDDWPQTISVPGMDKVMGLAQGDNDLSFAIRIISKDGDKMNFEVKAFTVSNPESNYAMLHVLDKPLPGVVDPTKKTLQIDFSPLATGLDSVETIDKADIDKVLMQDKDSLVLNAVMAVQSADASQVKFALSDMSLLQPDGVLDEFSLPGPVPAVYDAATDRFSTVAFDEVTNALQQNYVMVQNTEINVVNVVNEVNVVNVADFGGFGCGGIPYGGCYGDYGGYGGFGGGCFMPCADPLPMPPCQPCAPLGIPDDVQVYHGKPKLPHDRNDGRDQTSRGDRSSGHGIGDSAGHRDSTGKLPGGQAWSKTPDATGGKAPIKGTATAGKSGTPIKQAKDAVNRVASGGSPASKSASTGAKTPGNKPAVKPATQPASKTASAPKTSAVKAPVSTPVKQSAPRSAPATKAVSAPKTSVAKTPVSAPVKQSAPRSAPATKTVSAPKAAVRQSAPVRQASAPKVASQPARSRAPARTAAHAAPAAASHGGARGGGHR